MEYRPIPQNADHDEPNGPKADVVIDETSDGVSLRSLRSERSTHARTDRAASFGRERRYGPAISPRSAVPAKAKPGRRAKRRRAVSFGQMLLISSGFAGFAGTMLLLSDGGTSQTILVARQDLASGTALDQTNLVDKVVEMDADVADRLAMPDDVEGKGFVLAGPVEAGAPIPLTALVPADGSDQRSRLSLPIPVERAVGGVLKVGGRVHLIGVLRDQSTTFASFVATDVEITDVRESDGEGGLLNGSSGGEYFVTVALNPDDLLTVTTVLGAGTIELAEAPPGGGVPDISRSAVATEAGVVVVPRDTLVNAIESEGRDNFVEQPAEAVPVDSAPTEPAPTVSEPAQQPTETATTATGGG
jgi:hypothetical protein